MKLTLRYEDVEIVTCDSCNFPAPTAEFDTGPPIFDEPARPKRLLCEFCCKTVVSTYTKKTSYEPYEQLRAEIWRAAAGVYNMLKYGTREV